MNWFKVNIVLLLILLLLLIAAVTQTCSVKKNVLRNFAKFTGKHLCQSLYRDSGVGVFCEFYEISKNTFSYRTPPVAASVLIQDTVVCESCL